MKVQYGEAISGCTRLWALTKSPKASEKLLEALGEALKKPVPTRWNSLHDALIQIVRLKEKIMGIDELLLRDPLTNSNYR